VVELTDYLSSTTLKAKSSFLLWNSDVNPCLRYRPAVGEDGQPPDSRFDRCSPGALAFHDQQSAAAFADKH